MKKKFIIDADPGVDDIEAILFLMSRNDSEIVAITTVCGNGRADVTYQNIKKVLHFIDCSHIPVYKGVDFAIDGSDMGYSYHFGNDSMGDANLPTDFDLSEPEMSSPEAIIYYSKKYKGEISLVALGPLTNVAIAYLFDQKLSSYLNQVSIMCCDRSEKTTDNCSDFAEFNAKCDAAAVEIILGKFSQQALCPIYLIDWTVCQNSEFEFNIFDSIVENNKPLVNKKKKELMIRLEEKTRKKIINRFSDTGFVIADIFAAVTAYDTSIIKKFTKASLVECHTEGPTKGHTKFKEDPNGKITLIDEFDMARVAEYMIDIVTN